MGTTDYTWLFDFDELAFSKNVTNDFFARVKILQSLTTEDLAAMIAKERTEYRIETIVNITRLMDQKIREAVCGGNTVVTGTAVYAPTITGVFIGTQGEIDPAVHKCKVNITPSNMMRAEVAKVKPLYSGRTKDKGGAAITLVRDKTTGRTDGFVTPGEMVVVSGTKIRCLNADGSDIGSIKLLNSKTGAVAAEIKTLGINDPSRLLFNIPASLPEGQYRLVEETYYSNTSTYLKEPRTLEYPMLLTIGELPDGGGDDGGDDVLS